ncbi:MAG: hypothetical protein ACRDKX_05230 [Solirubrobacterales bacterium]
MSIRVLSTLAGCACLLAAIAAAPALAKPTPLSELRVEGPDGALDRGTWYVTGTERIKRSMPGDNCIRDEGRIKFPGATALGIVQTASEHRKPLRQVRVREDEAGPFVCEIGSIAGRPFTDPNGFSGWQYFQNYVSGSTSADLATLAPGDQVLWVFSDFGASMQNTGEALELLGVPARDADGTFTVQVIGHAFDGTETPADGATITGATATTPLGGGSYEVTVPQGRTRLTATRGIDVPSNHVRTCVEQDLDGCPSAHGRTIFGSAGKDRIKGTAGWDKITTGGGRDRVDLRSGGDDRVDCGGGRDTVKVKGDDRDDRIKANCERVR